MNDRVPLKNDYIERMNAEAHRLHNKLRSESGSDAAEIRDQLEEVRANLNLIHGKIYTPMIVDYYQQRPLLDPDRLYGNTLPYMYALRDYLRSGKVNCSIHGVSWYRGDTSRSINALRKKPLDEWTNVLLYAGTRYYNVFASIFDQSVPDNGITVQNYTSKTAVLGDWKKLAILSS